MKNLQHSEHVFVILRKTKKTKTKIGRTICMIIKIEEKKKKENVAFGTKKRACG